MSAVANSGVLRLEGALTMRTVPAIVETGRRKAAEGDLSVDFSAVAEADSAALALVLDWLRVSRESGHRLELLAMPKGLATLAALYGIDTLIPLHEVCPQ